MASIIQRRSIMLRGLAIAISVIFHPLLILTYGLVLLLMVNPYLFGVGHISERIPQVLLVFLSTFVIPTFAVIMMKLLGLVETLSLDDRKDRIGPYIVAGVFYLWLYVNFSHDPLIPTVYSAFVLGSVIGLFVAFFINLFSKISAHAVGMGGLLGMVLITMAFYSTGIFVVHFPFIGPVQMSMAIILILVVLSIGLVGTSRLMLDAHSLQDLYGGFLVGFVTQFIAFRIIM